MLRLIGRIEASDDVLKALARCLRLIGRIEASDDVLKALARCIPAAAHRTGNSLVGWVRRQRLAQRRRR